MFTFHLAYPPYFDKEASTLVNLMQNLFGDGGGAYSETAAEEIVHAFFDIVRKNTCDSFNHLVGAAFAICRSTQKHVGECECPVCSLYDSLEWLVTMSKDYEAQEGKILEGWGKGHSGLGWPQVNPHMENLKKEFVPKEFERMAKEYDAARERNEF